MAVLIPQDGVLFNCSSVAPSPSKDFWQVIVTTSEVLLRWWKITLRNDVRIKPGETKESYEDFLCDYKGQSDIQVVFGEKVLEYVMRLANGEIDYFSRLPKHIIVHVVQYLDLPDIARLSQLSKQFRRICRSNDLWQILYLGSGSSNNPDPDLEALAEEIGWRRLYFTNKLQLQVQLRRRKRKGSLTSPSEQSSELTSPSPSSSDVLEDNESPDSDDDEEGPLSAQPATVDSEEYLREMLAAGFVLHTDDDLPPVHNAEDATGDG